MKPDRIMAASDLAALSANVAFARKLARRLVEDSAQADDVAQEAWSAVLEHPPRQTQSLRGYLATIVRRTAGRRRREHARRIERERAVARPERLESDQSLVSRLELQRIVVDAVLALDEPYRSTLLRRFLDEETPEAIARATDVPLETVRTRIRRGLQRVRADLERRDPDPGHWLAGLVVLARPDGTWSMPVPTVADAAESATGSIAAGAKLAFGGTLVLLAGGAAWFLRPTPTRGAAVTPPLETARTENEAARVQRPGALPREGDVAVVAQPSGAESAPAAGSFRARGSVRDASGAPIADALVTAFLLDYGGTVELARGRTDAEGAYEVALAALDVLSPLQRAAWSVGVRVTAPGFGPLRRWVSAPLEPEAFDDWELALETGAVFVGRVVDVEGTGVADASVLLRCRDAEGGLVDYTDASDEHGGFHLQPGPGERPVEARAWKRRVGLARRSLADEPFDALPADARVELAPLVVHEEGYLRGRAVHPDGSPARGIEVVALREDPPEGDRVGGANALGTMRGYDEADDEGRFSIAGLVPGVYRLFAKRGFGAEGPSLDGGVHPSGSEGVVLVVEENRLVVELVDPGGTPLLSVPVACTPLQDDGEGGWSAGKTVRRWTIAREGEVARSGFFVTPGSTVSLQVSLVGASPYEARVRVPSRPFETVHRAVLHEAAHTGILAIALVGEGGEPVSAPYEVALLSPTTGSSVLHHARLVTDAEGALAVPAGEWRLRVTPSARAGSCHGSVESDAPVRVDAGRESAVSLVAPAGGHLRLVLATPEDADPPSPEFPDHSGMATELLPPRGATLRLVPMEAAGEERVVGGLVPGEPWLSDFVLRPGRWRATLLAKGRGPMEREFSVTACATAELSFDLATENSR